MKSNSQLKTELSSFEEPFSVISFDNSKNPGVTMYNSSKKASICVPKNCTQLIVPIKSLNRYILYKIVVSLYPISNESVLICLE